MALYTVSSSGNLKIADTGLKNPVSFFTPEGIATGAIAASPIAGNNSRVYIIDGQGNRFQSNGQINLIPGDFITGGNAIAATALGELPLGGADNFYLGTQVVKAFITSANQSSGNLKLSGSSTAIIARQIQSSGNLVLSGSIVQMSRHVEISNTGQLRITGNKVAPSTRQFRSSGQIRLFPVDGYRIILIESTTNQLKLTGNSAFGLKYNSAGNLKTTGSFTRNILLQPTSTGSITVATKWYTVNRLGGLSTDPIASAAVTSGTGDVQNILNTTRIAFYGITGLTSTGNLTITSYGTPDSDLTQDGVLAGSPLATSSIAERRFNPNSTQFRQLQNIDSAGALKFDNSVKYRIDSIGAQLVLNGTAGSNSDRRSSGSLVTTGSHTNSSLRIELSSGQIRLAPTGENPLSLDSSLAGSSLASLPLSGGVDLVTGVTKFNSLRTESTSGNLVLTGITGVGLKRISSGQLKITGSTVTRSLIIKTSNGQLTLTGSDYNTSRRNKISSGQLKIAGSIVTRSIRNEHSSGQLSFYPTDTFRIYMHESSTNRLSLTGTDYNTSTRIKLSSGILNIKSTGENPLGSDSGLSGSALAGLPLSGGIDYITGQTTFKSFRNETSSGNLITSSRLDSRSIRIEKTSGNLILSGNTVWNKTLVKTTLGNLTTTGSSNKSVTKSRTTNGNLLVVSNGTNTSLTVSGSISGSAIADHPIVANTERTILRTSVTYTLSGVFYRDAGLTTTSSGRILLSGQSKNTSIRQELSSGRLVITGTHVKVGRYVKTTSGQLRITGTTVTSNIKKYRFTTAGQLVIAGTHVKNVKHVKTTAGNLVTTGTHVKNVKHVKTTAGNLVTTGTHVIAEIYAETSTGRLRVTGTHSNSLVHNVSSNGSVITSGFTEITTTISGRTIYSIASNGNAHIIGTTSALHIFESLQSSSGGLVVSGNTVAVVRRSLKEETSSGGLVVSGNTVAVVRRSLKEETSSGNIVLNGNTVVRFISNRKKRANAGGGYVYASSWDILTPYFPDDRHILGYIDLKTSGTGFVTISGSSSVSFIQSPKVTISPKKKLSDYIKEVQLPPVKAEEILIIKPIMSRQALLEDELLLKGSLLDFESPEDELDRELLL
jgi:hypothetical protein